ncbi:MAG: PAAR domain-containing protein [Synergistaceae bacterium]|nr:PAAR domain-containing protein [Synergistaceae bacterium]MBR0205061.1 PAAR domain-containing protein [Synergistaceae bacterium]
MPEAARLGDICTGHADWPPRPNIEGSPNVFVNGRPLHRQGDAWAVHCNKDPECHGSVLASGSSTVYVNGRQAGRIGDPVACGGVDATGSPNVFIGD